MKETIGIGIIGTGFARTTQLPAFRACTGARVVAIASGHRANAEAVAREFDIPNVADGWREVVARPDVDLVSIVTPPVTHAEIALAVLDAGKAVLCEKPMAMNAAETDAMRQRAAQAQALALVDHELRLLAGRQRLRARLHAGEIGRVRHIRFRYSADSRASATRAWDWWSDERAGGGVLGAIGSHAVDACRWLLDAEVTNVCAQLVTHVSERPDERTGELRKVTTDDEANLLLRFTDGSLTAGTTGTISLSMVESGQMEHSLALYGERGALMIAEPEELFRAEPGAGAWQRIKFTPTPIARGMRDGSWSRGFTVFACEIVKALRAGRNTVAHAAAFADGHRAQLVLDAARRSHERGCWVSVK
ncbi:MAG: gfo/Idh/MocA family oxidoreductase [Acidobacteria bacterium]|nr:MAG: gfo/Idh/MocA family oxidoreductase [Acidobacteriota bacterium]